MNESKLPSSFRDPDGFIFSYKDIIYRQLNESSKGNYEQFKKSGLYDSLVEKNWLIQHKEISHPNKIISSESYYKILQPDHILHISYPYEWCFSALKDAAILTINIQQEALRHGMMLKDASAYNVQFYQGRPVFIDTLSFEEYNEGEPWVAYRQFCQHFLAPLALISKCDYRLLHLLRAYIDGIPLDLASKLLPKKSKLNYSLLAHIHLHAKTQKQHEDSGREDNSKKTISVSKIRLEGLLSSLLSAVNSLKWEHTDTEWGRYYSDTNYADQSMDQKGLLVKEMLNKCQQSTNATVADYGANTGRFSRIAAQSGYQVLSYDIDEVAVDKNYQKMKHDNETSILPLMLNLTNPSPGLGWANQERPSFIERSKVDVGIALAIIHHIAISNNVPLEQVADFFSTICAHLIIEFVPKSDSQVKRLLSTREDIFNNYNETGFCNAFNINFDIIDKVEIEDSERTLYLMRNKNEEPS